MTPDTAALRALADHMETLPPFVSFGGHVHPHTAQIETDTVRALCDAADEVERLRDEVERLSLLTSAELVYVSSADLTAERDASRTAHAALVAELRALHVRVLAADGEGDYPACGTCFDADENPEAWPCPTVTALDRHAPEETT